ncbi:MULTISPECIES: succinate dehydrogenase cytochrome b558 subunit [Paenibacillus]|jgi:succinate dehydrogenase / fumarate reductase cytochrome b subunit|uniref:Succinate dehydrogenase cytochrome b558 subunit n=1 Tax=Paenibacillus oceani TaxID=2772510 RepID=A0A927H0P0_9BACL|nr:succinate dehydrogenase cytochrome b558 subunit [Paenibacillus oceani]MBD2863342.1 succinate dehydrogenase cytochrome b558 subunit [Paenibacillus oceani]MDF2661789.1 succinate dehydrogenase cytochrome [Paenibacillus sp.]
MTGNSYYYRKLHSLLGVIPVGFFLVEHLITNYEAFNGGHQAFIDSVMWLNNLPLIFFLELFGIWIPILYHGVYGLYVAFQSRNNASRYGYFRNLMFTLQRVTGVVTLIFIGWHFFQTRFQVTLGNETHEGLGVVMHEIFTNPVFFTLYLIGVLAATFHFSNGMWSFLVSWGITVGPRAQRVSSVIWLGVFVIMSIMFVLTMVAFTDASFQDTSVLDLTSKH